MSGEYSISTEEGLRRSAETPLREGVDASLYRDLMSFAGRAKFRGTLIDNCAAAPMGKGHGNQGKPFDISTACYLKPLVAAYHEQRVRKVVVMAAVKTLKSFFLEMAGAHHTCHSIGDVGIFFGSAEQADDVSTTRILSYYTGIPSYQEKLATISGQWDVTMGAVKFPDKTLFIKPANLANAQQKNLGFVGVQDAFVCGQNGMIDQLIDRTTQYPWDKKIVLESQGGEKGFDFDRHYLDTDQGELHVKCPACDSGHVFNWKAFDEQWMTRPDDFKAVLPRQTVERIRATSEGDKFAALCRDAATELTELLKKPDRRVAGFKRGDRLDKLNLQSAAVADRPLHPSGDSASGEINEGEVLRNTCFECFHCGSIWRDDGEFGACRTGLDESSYYVSARKDALPENRGFNFPQWINRRLAWGPLMLRKIKAQVVAGELGNFEQLKIWWQKVAGRTWDPTLTKVIRAQTQEQYDLKSDWPEEWRGHRCLIVDCQFELQHFWASAWAVSKSGKSRQLWRGLLNGFGAPKKVEGEATNTIAGKQREFGILDQFVFLDGNYMKNELVEECVKHGHWATYDGEREWFCWTLLIGSPQKDFSHKSDQNAKVRHPLSEPFYEYPQVKVDKYRVSVEVYYFSALQMGDMFTRYRDGNGPETLFLPEIENADNKLSWTAQIHAPTKQHLVNNRTGLKTEIWLPATQTTPHHYFDIGRMFMAVHCIWGISGHFDFQEPGVATAEKTG